MAQVRAVVQRARRAAIADLTDGQLLASFVERHDQAAFTALVNRHGSMVWGVCRRLLNHHDAEEAFQATFLVLARKGASIKSRHLVGNWLYGVAQQAALQARRINARRRTRESQVANMPEPAICEPDSWHELQGILDAELSRLPDQYRSVIVLCDLEGQTRKEAARHLGCPEGTVAGRLARARAILAKRLARRGITKSIGALAVSAGVPPVSKAASLVTTGAISLKVVTLTGGVLKTMLMSKLKTVMAMVSVVLTGVGVGLLCYSTTAGQDLATNQKNYAKPKMQQDLDALQGTWYVTAMEEGGQPQPRQRFEDVKMRLVVNGDKLAILTTTPDGRDVGQQGMTITLDEKASPKQLNASKDGNIIPGIYAFEQGRLKICVDLRGASRPESFTTENGSNQRSYVLRKKDAKAK
jgi:RNA polymerase sigma factor (sigma-70 family)